MESATAADRERSNQESAIRALLWTGVVMGVGVVGTLDQVVLHEWLQWHTLYVHTDRFWRTVIDGAFHLVTASLLFIGAVRLWTLRHRLSRSGATGRALAAGILLGMGGFNLYDGTVQHKLLNLHPVREGVANQLPYDLAFNGVALALLAAGWWLWRGVKGQEEAAGRSLQHEGTPRGGERRAA